MKHSAGIVFGVILMLLFAPGSLWAQGPVQILVQGVDGEELDNVRAALALPSGLVKDGVVNEKWLERFTQQIPQKTREALEPFGFYDPAITVSPGLTTEDIHEVYVFIEPGEPVRVDRVSVTIRGPGEREGKLMELAAAFPLHRGARLLHRAYEEAKNSIRTAAVELGYLDAEFSTHEIRVDPEGSTATIELVLQTGGLYYFGEITFSGAPAYPSSFFGRFLEFKPGDVFSHKKIGLTQRNLINADRFRNVTIRTDKESASGHRILVEIRLEPSKPKRLKLGAGFETDIGLKIHQIRGRQFPPHKPQVRIPARPQ